MHLTYEGSTDRPASFDLDTLQNSCFARTFTVAEDSFIFAVFPAVERAFLSSLADSFEFFS